MESTHGKMMTSVWLRCWGWRECIILASSVLRSGRACEYDYSHSHTASSAVFVHSSVSNSSISVLYARGGHGLSVTWQTSGAAAAGPTYHGKQ
jgi:hypothetical protein